MAIKNILSDMSLILGKSEETAFLNRNGVYQDGTVPMYRDETGKLWAISGHSHLGKIKMFSGTCVDDLQAVYEINTNFTVGRAGDAFNGIKYPEGILSRGSVWPFGLYICPKTHRFFCFFHNETGWNGMGTAYDSFGKCDKPAFDSDFRHVGLMHSDDEGQNWTFDRWVLTANHVCCSDKYIPENQNVIGQKAGIIGLGSGDFTVYVELEGEYIYLFYNIIHVDMNEGVWKSCDTYVARTRKREDGVMGDFVKYYEGSFCEAGNLGKETKIVDSAWHSRVAYSTKLKKYLMVSTSVNPDKPLPQTLDDYLHIRTSDDIIHWSEPLTIQGEYGNFGNHYNAIVSAKSVGQPNIIDDDIYLLTCHNGTDVLKNKLQIKEK